MSCGRPETQIPQIVQHPLAPDDPDRNCARSVGHGCRRKVSAALDDLRFGQILDAGDAFGGIGQVFAWSRHGKALRGVVPVSRPEICTNTR